MMFEKRLLTTTGANETNTRPMSNDTFTTFAQDVNRLGLVG